MSAVISGIGNYLQRTTGVADITGGYSCGFWARFNSVPQLTDNDTLFALIDDFSVYSQYVWMGRQGADPDQVVLDVNGSGTAKFTFALGEWNYYGYTFTLATNTHRFYVNGVVVGSVVVDVSTFVLAEAYLGSDTYDTDVDKEIAFFFEVEATYSDAQMQAQQAASTPADPPVFTFSPLAADFLDTSGNGHTWTEVGSVTFDTQPGLNDGIEFATGERVERTSGLLPFSSDGTWMFWANFLSSTIPGEQNILLLRSNAGETVLATVLSDLGGGTGWGLAVTNDGITIHLVDGLGFTPGRWMHIAYVKSGNNHTLYANGDLRGAVTVNISAGTISKQHLGGDSHPATVGGIQMYGYKEWDDNLSQLEVRREMNATAPWQELGDLYTYSFVGPSYADLSGNGHNWTAVGTPTFVPGVAIPASATPSGAIDAGTSLPYTNSGQMYVTDAIVFDRWYKRTAQPGEEVLGVWAKGIVGSFEPTLTVWSPDATTSFLNISNTGPIQIPVSNGVEYFFQIVPSDDDRLLTAAPIEMSMLRSPEQIVPVGSIFVNDDQEGFPLAMLSSVNGDDYNVLDFIHPFPSGEAGDTLNDGTKMFHDNVSQEMVGYNAAMTEIFRLTGYVDTSLFGIIRQNRGTQRFWVLNEVGANLQVRYITGLGVEGTVHVVGTRAGVKAQTIATNSDETVAYMSVGSNTGGFPTNSIIAFNLTNDTIIGVFAPAIASHVISDILCLSDDTILAVYSNSSSGNVQVLHFDAAGTILRTLSFGTDNSFPSGTLPRIAYGLLDPQAFWIWRHPASTPFVSKFAEVSLVTGSELRSVLGQEYEGGEYFADVVEDPVRFGNSFSCVFIVATQGFVPPEPPEDECPAVID